MVVADAEVVSRLALVVSVHRLGPAPVLALPRLPPSNSHHLVAAGCAVGEAGKHKGLGIHDPANGPP